MRDLTVSIYDENLAPLRWRGNTVVADLEFSSALPGGFMQCSFTLQQPQGRVSPLSVGQTVYVSRGNTIVWAGWLEDIQTIQHSRYNMRSVLAFGSYQQVIERLVSASYIDTETSWILRDLLAQYCSGISADYQLIVDSGVGLTADWLNTRFSDIVKTICDVGNTSNQELLFAIWEPPGSRTRLSKLSILIDDGEMEEEELYWTNVGCTYVTSPYHSDGHSWKSEGVSDTLAHKRDVPVTGGASYVVGWWVYWTAYANMTTKIEIDWYDADMAFISTSTTDEKISDSKATGWQEVVDTVSAPTNARFCALTVSLATSAGPGQYQCVDDVTFYQELTLAENNKPRASLWARDLSSYDYTLTTALLDEGLTTVQTTRDLANAVWATYGEAVTDVEQDADSQALYRRRDHVLDAGDVAQADAEAQRDVYLARHATPGTEVQGFSIKAPDAVRTVRGQVVDPALLRAGDRCKIIDGELAGTVIMLRETSWKNGVVTCKPESYEDVTRTLAKM